MIRTLPERIIPRSEAAKRLDEILQTLGDDQIWVVAEDGAPKAAIVDAQFLEKCCVVFGSTNLPPKPRAGFPTIWSSRVLTLKK